MPEQEVIDRANRDKEEGKSPSTRAGEFVREEMHHIREGKHGAANTKQAIAIGLSKARRAGVELPQPREGSTSESTRKQVQRHTEKGEEGNPAPSRTRSRAVSTALKREGHSAASPANLSRQAKSVPRSARFAPKVLQVGVNRREKRTVAVNKVAEVAGKLLVQNRSQHCDYEVREMRSAFI
jgi:Family of unknown function (DUF6496)